MDLTKIRTLRGEITVPGDKSISHRSIMFGSIARGTTEITGFLKGADCLSTISCFRKMGIEIIEESGIIKVMGKGIHGLTRSDSILDVGNSGTTTRLMSGILAGQNFTSILDGDDSIRKRPMRRIIEPLVQMGINVKSKYNNDCMPLEIAGGKPSAIDYKSNVSSAQVKSCVLLAGLYADGKTSFTEPTQSRNHTELMLSSFGADIKNVGTTTYICPADELYGQKINVPGDISSAAYFIVAGLIVPGAEITVKNVGINPTRDGLIRVCKDMGGDITLTNIRIEGGEPVADIIVRYSHLHGTTIEGSIIPTLIDEIPVIAIMASLAEGTTTIKDAAELKVKESDRIAVITENLTKMGCDITATDDGMIIYGSDHLNGAVVDSYLDHRIAMSFAVASLVAEGTTSIVNGECVNISYPDFYKDLTSLCVK